MSLHIRDLPDRIHGELVERAAVEGMSLRQYVIEILSGHCRLPTLDGWLQGLDELEPVAPPHGGAAALVAEARAADDQHLDEARARRGR